MRFLPTRAVALAVALLVQCLGPSLNLNRLAAEELEAAPLLEAQLRDLEDHPVRLKSFLEKGAPGGGGGGGGTVLVVLHQDRTSSDQSPDFKVQLGKLTESPAGRQRLRLVALADVGGYDFWPARRYVKDALRPLREEGGALVLADWQGAVRKRYRIAAGQSVIFVVSPSGELRALKRGLLGKDEAAQVLQIIAGLLAN